MSSLTSLTLTTDHPVIVGESCEEHKGCLSVCCLDFECREKDECNDPLTISIVIIAIIMFLILVSITTIVCWKHFKRRAERNSRLDKS